MFDIGWGEFVVIGAVALVVIGPKELPGVLRTVGGAVSKLKRMAGEFQQQFNDAIRESEFEEARKAFDGANNTINSGSTFNPIQTIRDEIKNAVEGTGTANATTTTTTPPAADATPTLPAPEVQATAPAPILDIPPPPPVPDLTPEQIQAAFASPTVPEAEAAADETPAPKRRTKKAETADTAETPPAPGATSSVAGPTTAPAPAPTAEPAPVVAETAPAEPAAEAEAEPEKPKRRARKTRTTEDGEAAG